MTDKLKEIDMGTLNRTRGAGGFIKTSWERSAFSTKKLGVNLGALVKLYRDRIKQYRNNLKLHIYKE